MLILVVHLLDDMEQLSGLVNKRRNGFHPTHNEKERQQHIEKNENQLGMDRHDFVSEPREVLVQPIH